MVKSIICNIKSNILSSIKTNRSVTVGIFNIFGIPHINRILNINYDHTVRQEAVKCLLHYESIAKDSRLGYRMTEIWIASGLKATDR